LEQVSAGRPGIDLSPLIHRTKEGVLLKRAPDVDAQIRDVLLLLPDELVKRAEKGTQDSGFLKDETLVYLIRAFFKSGNKETTNQLSQALINRWEPFIYSKLTGLVDAEDAFSIVISTLFKHILFRDDGRGDCLQVRFGFALKRITISVFRNQMAKLKADQSTLTFSDLSGEEGEEIDWGESEEDVNHQAEIAFPDMSTEDKVLVRAAINILEEPLRTTYILRNMYDFQIESIDPTEPTISKYFGLDPRTIRYRLKQAQKILIKWQGENHE
jgi:DNA-directed RNA polymerase specialized sigma24 family protein